MKNAPPLQAPPCLQPDAVSRRDTVAQLLVWAESVLKAHEVATPRLDAEVLLADALHISRSGLYARLRAPVSLAWKNDFRRRVARRCQREPVAYITGRQEFWSLEFRVNPRVLIPRPDTEIVVETALRLLSSSRIAAPRILDMGTGSGCIALALATELPRAEVWAVDTTPAILSVAQQNARAHRVGQRVTFCRGDLFAAVPPGTPLFDLLVTNPPYIASPALDTLQPEVRLWEPRAGLDGGANGLDFYGRLLYHGPNYMRPGGWLVAEIGATQKEAVTRRGRAQPRLRFQTCGQDHAGRDRVVVFQKRAGVEQE